MDSHARNVVYAHEHSLGASTLCGALDARRQCLDLRNPRNLCGNPSEEENGHSRRDRGRALRFPDLRLRRLVLKHRGINVKKE